MAKTNSKNDSQPIKSLDFISSIDEPEDTLFTKSQSSSSSGWWQTISIRWKAMVLAVAMGTLPTVALGMVAYWTATNSITEEITSVRKTLAVDLRNQVNLFMEERLKDIQIMSELDILTNPQLQTVVSPQDKAVALENIQATYDIYNSIAIFDLQGDVVAQTGIQPLGNHFDRGYIQAALQNDRAILSQPKISTTSGIYSVYAAAPVKNKVTGETIGVIRARIPVAAIAELLQDFVGSSDRYYLLNEEGTIFLDSAGKYVISTLSNNQTVTQKSVDDYEAVQIGQVFTAISPLLDSEVPLTIKSAMAQDNSEPQFIAFAPPSKADSVSDLNWQVLITTDSSKVFASQRKLQQVYTLGTMAIALLVGVIAYYLADLATRPILSAAKTVEEIGKGNLKVRTTTKGQDEVAQLGKNINLMAFQLEDFVQEQHFLAQQTNIIKQTVIDLGSALDKESVWKIAVNKARQGLRVEGVSYYRIQENKQNTIVAESELFGTISTVGKEIFESSFIEENILQQPTTSVFTFDNVTIAGLTPSQTEQLIEVSWISLGLVTIKQQEQTVGLLIAHRSLSNQPWEQLDKDFLEQIANQISFTLERLDFLQQQQDAQLREKEAKESLQARAFELLRQVDPFSQGDLTVRAKVTEDEIGTIADSYNAAIYSLQKLVTQVKTAANQVEQTAGTNQTVIEQLATNAINQAQSMAQTMQQIQSMSKSITNVSDSALMAQQVVSQTNETITLSDRNMNQAVTQINALQVTVQETEKKVRLLNESSQEISQVVNSISRFAAQTHLLALKASIEAARAGEQGKGFATIADEVRSLASQSATATTDIENIVAKIQLETNEVVTAMTQGTKQVNQGTELVRQTRQSLSQITTASQEINQLITAIAESAQGQSILSQQVSSNVAQVAVSAQTNSQSATQVSLEIEQLLSVANKLQTDIDQFKT